MRTKRLPLHPCPHCVCAHEKYESEAYLLLDGTNTEVGTTLDDEVVSEPAATSKTGTTEDRATAENETTSRNDPTIEDVALSMDTTNSEEGLQYDPEAEEREALGYQLDAIVNVVKAREYLGRPVDEDTIFQAPLSDASVRLLTKGADVPRPLYDADDEHSESSEDEDEHSESTPPLRKLGDVRGQFVEVSRMRHTIQFAIKIEDADDEDIHLQMLGYPSEEPEASDAQGYQRPSTPDPSTATPANSSAYGPFYPSVPLYEFKRCDGEPQKTPGPQPTALLDSPHYWPSSPPWCPPSQRTSAERDHERAQYERHGQPINLNQNLHEAGEQIAQNTVQNVRTLYL